MKKKGLRSLSKLRVIIRNNKALVTWQRSSSSEPRSSRPVHLEYLVPLEMEWYLHEYFEDPLPYLKRGWNAEQGMRHWGQKYFDLLFQNRRNRQAQAFFQEATRGGLDKCAIIISSDVPRVLLMPWELLHSGDHGYLAMQLGGMYRTLNHYAIHAPLTCKVRKRLNILLIISREQAGKEKLNPFGSARPLLELLKPFIRQGEVSLKVLRPPTFMEFEREINKNKGYYNIVHYDGHGLPGEILFVGPEGEPDFVSGERLACSLRNGRVPIVILNSCSSAIFRRAVFSPSDAVSETESKDVISSVATEMLKMGANAVVGTAFSVLAGPMNQFILRLYKELLQGADVSGAVTAGRLEMMTYPFR